MKRDGEPWYFERAGCLYLKSLNGSLQSQITRKNIDFSVVFRYSVLYHGWEG